MFRHMAHCFIVWLYNFLLFILLFVNSTYQFLIFVWIILICRSGSKFGIYSTAAQHACNHHLNYKVSRKTVSNVVFLFVFILFKYWNIKFHYHIEECMRVGKLHGACVSRIWHWLFKYLFFPVQITDTSKEMSTIWDAIMCN